MYLLGFTVIFSVWIGLYRSQMQRWINGGGTNTHQSIIFPTAPKAPELLTINKSNGGFISTSVRHFVNDGQVGRPRRR